MENKETVIKLENVHKTYFIRDKNNFTIRERLFTIFKSNPKRQVNALKNINLEIYKGEVLGVIGHNGCGKSTLLQIINGIYPYDKGGCVSIYGKTLRLALGMGFNLEFSARQNIYINGSLMGMSFKQIGKRFDDIISLAGLHDFVDTKLAYYSSGMRSRLAFGIAMYVEADIYLMDEFFGGVGDINFRELSAKLFKDTFIKGHTVILVSHDLDVIEDNCTRVVLIHGGEIIKVGTPSEVIQYYRQINS